MSSIYVLSKLFAYLVLPPGIFIVLFFVASFYAKRFRLFFLANAIVFYLLSTTYVADWLLAPLEAPFNKPLEKQPVDAVVVLSGGSTKGVANLPLGDEAYKRVSWGLMVAKSNNLPLLFSGAGINQDFSESDAFLESVKEIKTYLALDIPSARGLQKKEFSLYVENKSIDTYENAKLSKLAFEKAGLNEPTIYLVTSAYHMRRSIRLYEYFGFKVIPAATGFKISTKTKDEWDYLPNAYALYESYVALREYAGLLSLKFRGI